MTRLDALRRERGQVAVLFALMLPMLLALAAFVIGIGNWYVHGKHLQTKADAGALAGGGAWAFPCRHRDRPSIEDTARLYARSNNPQVGGVPNSSIHTVINGDKWYDNDSNPSRRSTTCPTNPSVCASNVLDVKVTEDNSFPLASLIPLFPDIKRKARVEIDRISSTGGDGLVPIAVRSPVPVSAARVLQRDRTGNVLGVKYFVKSGQHRRIPGGLQGWTTQNPDDASPGATLGAVHAKSPNTGVAIAISLRGACNTESAEPGADHAQDDRHLSRAVLRGQGR